MTRQTSNLGCELEAAPTMLHNLTTGESGLGVHVRWRPPGQRNFDSFHLWLDEGQTIPDLLEAAPVVVDRLYSGQPAIDAGDDDFET